MLVENGSNIALRSEIVDLRCGNMNDLQQSEQEAKQGTVHEREAWGWAVSDCVKDVDGRHLV
jgi:hypothetical protein